MESKTGDITYVHRFVRRGRTPGVQGSNLGTERPRKKKEENRKMWEDL